MTIVIRGCLSCGILPVSKLSLMYCDCLLWYANLFYDIPYFGMFSRKFETLQLLSLLIMVPQKKKTWTVVEIT